MATRKRTSYTYIPTFHIVLLFEYTSASSISLIAKIHHGHFRRSPTRSSIHDPRTGTACPRSTSVAISNPRWRQGREGVPQSCAEHRYDITLRFDRCLRLVEFRNPSREYIQGGTHSPRYMVREGMQSVPGQQVEPVLHRHAVPKTCRRESYRR